MKNIRPTPGNHEHLTNQAAPYYDYFGSRAGSSKKGYYSYDIGEWHAVVLNSEIDREPRVHGRRPEGAGGLAH